jgi:hypothetical protein
MSKTEVVDLDENYNFVIDAFSIWIYLGYQILILKT